MISLDTLASRIAVNEDGCWIWTDRTNMQGRAKCGGRSVCRDAYLRLVGEIPAGLELDHLCCVALCVNPYHKDPVTHAENMRRRYLPMVTCAQGHLFTPENTRVYRSRRICRSCDVRRQLAYQDRMRTREAS